MGQEQQPPNAGSSASSSETESKDRQELVDLVNAAVTSQVKRHFKDVVTEKSLKAMFDDFKTTMAPQPVDDKTKEAETELARLKKKQEEYERRVAEMEQRAVQAEQQRREDKARSDLRTLLGGGLDPKLRVKDELVDFVIAKLVDRDKALKIKQDGTVEMTVVRSPVQGMDPEPQEMPLVKAVAEWFRTKDASAVMAALPLPGGNGKPSTARPIAQAGQPQRIADVNARPQTLDEGVNAAMQDFAALGIDPAALARAL